MEKQEAKPVVFFDELSSRGKQYMQSMGTQVEEKSGHVLIQEGEVPEHIYLILKGNVKLMKITEDGQEFTVQLKQKGQLVGDLVLFNSTPFNLSAIVMEDSELIRYERHELEYMFEQYGELAVAYIKWQTRDTQAVQSKFRDLMLYGKTGGLYSTLIRFSNSYGKKVEEGIKIDLRLTNQDIANYIGTSRENVNRMLADLKGKNVLTVRKGYITIKDIHFLREYLQCGNCPVDFCVI